MGEFKLDKVQAVIKPGGTLLQATTVPLGKDAKPTKVTEVQLVIEVAADKAIKQVEALFPSAKVICDQVAGDDMLRGVDLVTRTKLADSSLAIWYGDDKEPVIDAGTVTVKSRPQLRIDEKGDAKLVIRPRVKLTGKQLDAVAQLIEADCRVSMAPAQLDLPDVTTQVAIQDSAHATRKGGRGKGKGKAGNSEEAQPQAAQAAKGHLKAVPVVEDDPFAEAASG